MDYVRLGGDIGRCSVPREESLPRCWIGHAGIEVVEYATGEDLRLFERRIADACVMGLSVDGDGGAFYFFTKKKLNGGAVRILTAEGGDRAEHATMQHALWLAWMIVAHTCDFSGVGAVV